MPRHGSGVFLTVGEIFLNALFDEGQQEFCRALVRALLEGQLKGSASLAVTFEVDVEFGLQYVAAPTAYTKGHLRELIVSLLETFLLQQNTAQPHAGVHVQRLGLDQKTVEVGC
mgnify:CR=1 FL=1